MKLSANPLHPDYSPIGCHLAVYLDGEYVMGCVSADTDAGVVERFVFEDGRLVVDGNHVRLETVRGVVTVELQREAPALLKRLMAQGQSVEQIVEQYRIFAKQDRSEPALSRTPAL